MLKLLDGFAFCGKFHVGINRVNLLAAGMAHQALADFHLDAGFHQPGIEGVPQVVKPKPTNARTPYGSLPSGLQPQQGFAPIGKHQALILFPGIQQVVQSDREGYLAGFAFRSLTF